MTRLASTLTEPPKGSKASALWSNLLKPHAITAPYSMGWLIGQRLIIAPLLTHHALQSTASNTSSSWNGTSTTLTKKGIMIT